MFGAGQGLSTFTSASRDGVRAASIVLREMQLHKGKCHAVSHAALQRAVARVGFSC